MRPTKNKPKKDKKNKFVVSPRPKKKNKWYKTN